MLESDDGVHFTLSSDRPVFSPEDCGTPDAPGSAYGSVQDPRVCKLDDGRYYMTFAYRPYAWSSHPTGVGVPHSHETDFPGVHRPGFDPATPGSGNVTGGRPDNMTRSGLAVSEDLRTWRFHSWITPADVDDRDVILFPQKINEEYVVLRRPLQYVGPKYGTPGPSMWISTSDDLRTWSEPTLLATAKYAWEDNRIGGSTPPIKTDAGWLILYHGVETLDASIKRVVYRLGAMMLDLTDPTKVIARCPHFLMEPETYYERFGLYIPNVIFPTANVVVGEELWLYYGCCDTSIALATTPLAPLVQHVMEYGTET
jgi:beta-1,2-mannobiose phosphorylase / 1,2-beta-oligomannan phosphorylase